MSILTFDLLISFLSVDPYLIQKKQHQCEYNLQFDLKFDTAASSSFNQTFELIFLIGKHVWQSRPPCIGAGEIRGPQPFF